MKQIFTLFAIIGMHLLASGQYVTPGLGEAYTLQELVALSQGVVTQEADDEFHIHDDLTISVDDSLMITEDVTVKIAAAKRIFVNGTLISDPAEQAVFTAIDPENNFRGFRFDGSHNSVLRNTIVEYGGGIQLLNSHMLIEDCIIRYNDRSNTSGAVNLSNSNPVIRFNTFLENAGSAIGSGANINAAPQVLYNQLIRNSTENTNRPQINLGPTGGDTTKVIGNVIEGFYTMAGGIAISNLLGGGTAIALIEDNLVFDNRYGYTATGNNIMSIIRSNSFINNNIQGEPAQGGSGLNFFGNTANYALVYNNIIQGNLWGVTIQGAAQPNLGEEDNPMTGFNVIENNSNSGVTFGLYNNTAEPIMAQNNYWGTDDEETAGQYIVGQHQNPELGPVTYLPIWVPENLIEVFDLLAADNDGLEADITGVIDQDALTVTLTVPFGTVVTNLTPSIEVSPYAMIMPGMGQEVDFTAPVTYTVTSFHGVDRSYQVTVILDDPPVFTLTFNVVDPEGDALADAVITLDGVEQPAGQYVFEGLAAGTYDYIVEKQGYFSADGTVVIDDEDVTVEVTLDPATNIAGPGPVRGLAVYPNPARNHIEVNFNDNRQGNVLRIYSITGNMVLERTNLRPQERLDVSSLESGLYLLQFSSGTKTLTRKLTITR
jgi:hypothetical protein